MATIGRNAAVSEYPLGFRRRGFTAWIAWALLHLYYLAGFRNRLSALLTWGWSYLTFDRGLRVVFEPSRSGQGGACSVWRGRRWRSPRLLC